MSEKQQHDIATREEARTLLTDHSHGPGHGSGGAGAGVARPRNGNGIRGAGGARRPDPRRDG